MTPAEPGTNPSQNSHPELHANPRGVTHWLYDAWQDVRVALRMLRKAPGFAAIAVITLALGIGASTALFSVVNGVLIQPLAYRDPAQIVAIYERSPGFDHAAMSYPNFQDWQRDAKAFSSIAMYRNEDYNFTGNGIGERLAGYMVSAEFFTTLGVQPILGRTFRVDEDHIGAAPVVILSGGFWKRKFAESPDVLGKPITLNGTTYTIIGVAPPTFSFYGHDKDVFTPIGQYDDPSFRDRRIEMSSAAIGRMKSGVTLSEARANMDGVAQNLATAYPEADKGLGINVFSMKDDMVGNVQPFLLVLLGAVGFLLLIACANVANLLLARSMDRSREFAIRSALGAGRGRVIMQLLTESVLLAGLGGVLGILVAFWATKGVLSTLPGALPRANDVSLDGRVLLFTLALSIVAGVAFGLAPALKTSRVDLQETLKEGTRGSGGGRHRLQGIFVVVEVAMALVLLVGAGLMIRSLSALLQVNPGFNPSHAIAMSLSLPATPNTSSAETRARLRAFDAKINEIPGVVAESVTLGSRPMKHNSTLPFWIEGQPKPVNSNDMHQGLFYLAEAGFEKAMGITMLQGRFITPEDNEHSRIVIVIDDVFARTYFPNQDPIGKRVNFGAFEVQAEIVGVAAHIKQWGLDTDASSAIEAQFYYPFMQMPEKLMALAATGVAVVIRTEGDPSTTVEPVRRAVEQLDPREVIYNVQTMDEIVATSFAARRFSMILLGIFGALALVLSCVGIYGVISYLVGQRTREIGVRIALGAQRGEVLRLILGEGTRMALVGVFIGIAVALGLTRLMSRMIFGVSATDPLTFGSVAVLLALVALAACYVPARRAMRVDPMVALRFE